MYKIFSALILSVIIFSVGIFCGYKLTTPKQITREVEVIKTIDKIVYRDYSKSDCCKIAYNYDTTSMQIKYNINSLQKNYTDIDVTWRLYERTGAENIHVPVYQEGNWKFYAGIGIGVVVIGGLSYMILK
jgi:hypothetical protein